MLVGLLPFLGCITITCTRCIRCGLLLQMLHVVWPVCISGVNPGRNFVGDEGLVGARVSAPHRGGVGPPRKKLFLFEMACFGAFW